MIKSVNVSQEGIIKDIMRLENIGRFDLDPTYSLGNFYKGIPEPRIKYDIDPKYPDVGEYDVRILPLPDESIHSIMFDPPFLGGGGKNGIIKKRFGGFDSIPLLWKFYEEAIRELCRVLKGQGVLVVKCQDCVDSRQQHLSHYEIITHALLNGLYPKDLYILVADQRITRKGQKNQQHARKHHSYFIVFKKSNRTLPYKILKYRDK